MISFDDFKIIVERNIKEKYENYCWYETIKEKYLTDPFIFFHNPIILYKEVRCSYINGCYLSTIPIIYNAIEQFLLWKNLFIENRILNRNKEKNRTSPNLRLKRTPKTIELFNQVLKNKIIDKQLYNEIIDFKKIRDNTMHAKSPGHYNVLGYEYDRESDDWIIPENIAEYIGPKPCAENGIELFFKVLKFNIEQQKKGIFD